MEIRDMSPQEVESLLARARLGRIACTSNGQPHITPLSLVHEKGSLFAFSMLGRKIAWMRQNPLVCVEFEEIQSPQLWKVVLVEGRYQELPDASEPLARHAFALLQQRPMWWEPGYARPAKGGSDLHPEPVYFRIAIESAKGRCAEAG